LEIRADDYLQNIKEGIEGKPVDWYSDVFDLVFTDVEEAQVNGLWKKELAKPPKEEAEREDSDGSLLN
jgi:Lon-like ATP-dependent protease